MLRRYVEQILNVFNYIDAILVTNERGIIEYYVNNRPDQNRLNEKDIRGKNILEVYPDLNEEESSIYRVIRSGKPIYNEFQVMRAAGTGQVFNGVNTTIPIKADGKVIGVAEVTRWVDDEFSRKDIPLSLKEAGAQSERLYTVDDIITCSPQMKEIKDQQSGRDGFFCLDLRKDRNRKGVSRSIHPHGRTSEEEPFRFAKLRGNSRNPARGYFVRHCTGELYRSGKPSRIV